MLNKISKISLIPFLGSFAEALGTVIEKRILRKKKIQTRVYNTFSFMTIVFLILAVCLPLSFLFPNILVFKFPPSIWQTPNLIRILIVIAFSILANLFTFYALKWEKLTEIEPMRLMQPLFTIIFALIFYTSERNVQIHVLIAAIIASLTLVFSHIKKHHFSLNSYAWSAIAGSFFFALELVISKPLLEIYSPISLYLVRCTGIFIFSLLIFRPNFKKIEGKTRLMILSVSFIWIAYRMLLYLSYGIKGVITTTLLFILTPIFIYFLSYLYLKEKPSLRNIIASIIILACVVYAMIMNGI